MQLRDDIYCHGLSQWRTSDALIEEQKPGQLVVLIQGSKAKEEKKKKHSTGRRITLKQPTGHMLR
jgi:hypothetical protein